MDQFRYLKICFFTCFKAHEKVQINFFIFPNSKSKIYIVEREGTWMWLHSVELAAVQGWWGAHSPNNDPANSDDCGKLVVDKSWFYLEDINCAHSLAAPLCQRNKFIRA